MKRCSFCEWIPILPWPVWPLARQCPLGQNTVVGSMTLLLAVRGNIATRSMSGPPFALQLHCTTVWCGATTTRAQPKNALKGDEYQGDGSAGGQALTELPLCVLTISEGGRVAEHDHHEA